MEIKFFLFSEPANASMSRSDERDSLVVVKRARHTSDKATTRTFPFITVIQTKTHKATRRVHKSACVVCDKTKPFASCGCEDASNMAITTAPVLILSHLSAGFAKCYPTKNSSHDVSR